MLRLSKWNIAAAVTVAVAGGLVVSAFGSGGDGKNPGVTTDTAWTLPPKPDPGVRDEVNRLLTGEPRRAAAQEELVYRCMALRGFSYIKASTRKEAAPLEEDYGITGTRAARHGYHLRGRPGIPAAPPKDGEIDQTAGLSAAGRNAWHAAFGGPRDAPSVRVALPGLGVVEESSQGCLAEARTRIYGSPAQQIRARDLAARLPAMARDRSAADPLLKRLNEAWAACMAAKGYRGIGSPDDARRRVMTTRTEIRLAVADARCESAFGYAHRRRLLEDRYYTAGLRYFGSGAAELRALNDRAARQAKQILG